MPLNPLRTLQAEIREIHVEALALAVVQHPDWTNDPVDLYHRLTTQHGEQLVTRVWERASELEAEHDKCNSAPERS